MLPPTSLCSVLFPSPRKYIIYVALRGGSYSPRKFVYVVAAASTHVNESTRAVATFATYSLIHYAELNLRGDKPSRQKQTYRHVDIQKYRHRDIGT